jgi:hypothetical protein
MSAACYRLGWARRADAFGGTSGAHFWARRLLAETGDLLVATSPQEGRPVPSANPPAPGVAGARSKARQPRPAGHAEPRRRRVLHPNSARKHADLRRAALPTPEVGAYLGGDDLRPTERADRARPGRNASLRQRALIGLGRPEDVESQPPRVGGVPRALARSRVEVSTAGRAETATIVPAERSQREFEQ